MNQIVLNDYQACWFIQLMSYNFIIQYHQNTLNSANESFWKSDYMMMKQNKKHHESTKKLCESNLKQSQSMSKCVSSSSINKLTFWWVDNLMSTLVNKFATAALEMSKQYNCNIRETDFEAESLIWILSLQATIQSKIKLTADNLVLYSNVTGGAETLAI